MGTLQVFVESHIWHQINQKALTGGRFIWPGWALAL